MAFCQRGSPDILSGQHDPKELAKHRDHRCRKNEEEIAKSLEGDYRNELLFTLRQTVELYDLYTEKLRACDGEIERQLYFARLQLAFFTQGQ